jgi:hypothetical protein
VLLLTERNSTLTGFFYEPISSWLGSGQSNEGWYTTVAGAFVSQSLLTKWSIIKANPTNYKRR